jgi:hypothetical protein
MKRFLGAMACAVTLAAVGLATPASADLVTNGGFETGDFTGWTVVANSTDVAPCGSFGCHSGNYFAALGNVGVDGTLSQSIADTAGKTLVLSYWLASEGNTPNDFSVDWNGVQVVGSALTNIPKSGYVQYSFDVTSTGSDVLTFLESDNFGYLGLDDVSLNYVGAVPEPASLALLGTGLVAAAGARRRRRKHKKA